MHSIAVNLLKQDSSPETHNELHSAQALFKELFPSIDFRICAPSKTIKTLSLRAHINELEYTLLQILLQGEYLKYRVRNTNEESFYREILIEQYDKSNLEEFKRELDKNPLCSSIRDNSYKDTLDLTSIRDNSHKDTLDLSSKTLNCHFIFLLFEALARNTSIKTLNLSNIRFSSEVAFKLLLKLLNKKKDIKVLDLPLSSSSEVEVGVFDKNNISDESEKFLKSISHPDLPSENSVSTLSSQESNEHTNRLEEEMQVEHFCATNYQHTEKNVEPIEKNTKDINRELPPTTYPVYLPEAEDLSINDSSRDAADEDKEAGLASEMESQEEDFLTILKEKMMRKMMMEARKNADRLKDLVKISKQNADLDGYALIDVGWESSDSRYQDQVQQLKGAGVIFSLEDLNKEIQGFYETVEQSILPLGTIDKVERLTDALAQVVSAIKSKNLREEINKEIEKEILSSMTCQLENGDQTLFEEAKRLRDAHLKILRDSKNNNHKDEIENWPTLNASRTNVLDRAVIQRLVERITIPHVHASETKFQDYITNYNANELHTLFRETNLFQESALSEIPDASTKPVEFVNSFIAVLAEEIRQMYANGTLPQGELFTRISDMINDRMLNAHQGVMSMANLAAAQRDATKLLVEAYQRKTPFPAKVEEQLKGLALTNLKKFSHTSVNKNELNHLAITSMVKELRKGTLDEGIADLVKKQAETVIEGIHSKEDANSKQPQEPTNCDLLVRAWYKESGLELEPGVIDNLYRFVLDTYQKKLSQISSYHPINIAKHLYQANERAQPQSADAQNFSYAGAIQNYGIYSSHLKKEEAQEEQSVARLAN